MQLETFIAAMERIAPPELALGFDNPGLLIGPEKRDIRRVLVALDATPAVAEEAANMGAELVLTHHPLFFTPVRHILPDDPDTAAAYSLIRRGIGLYAAHTNLDAAAGGVNDTLCELLQLTDRIPYDDGIGRIGTLPKAMTLRALVQLVNETLDTNAAFLGDPSRIVTRVATLGGAGGDSYVKAHALGADVLVTGEMKHHESIGAETLGLAAIVGGHYETERIVLHPLIARLQSETNDVQYNLTRTEHALFARV